MIVLHTIADFRAFRRSLPSAALTPFVPTMGALHEGHASLIRQARAMESPPDAPNQRGTVLASIFVNPTQFGPSEDYTRYPRTLEADLALLEQNGAQAVFVPSAEEIYPTLKTLDVPLDSHGLVTIDPGPLASRFEGEIRPGHFRGVCTIVAKLLNIVEPSHLLLGQKDFQQQAILRRMCLDLNMPVELVTCPTVREPDGLALSSRNRYLSPDERARAVALFEALTTAHTAYQQGERRASRLETIMRDRLQARGTVPQYAAVAHAATLEPVADAVTPPAVLLIAAKLGATRLIDNMLLP